MNRYLFKEDIMCGIVGYIGNKKAEPILIEGLTKLEYRGYDSAGLTILEKENFKTIKNKGRVKQLSEITSQENLVGTIGIAHTRWATHGKPSSTNSHPHNDSSNTFSIVHNGIIENYQELRKFLGENGYQFLSETDTEVIPNLIHYYFSKENEHSENTFLKAVNSATKHLKGSFAIGVLCTHFPDIMIVVRKDSPLVIGKGDGENFISSDIPAYLSFTHQFYFLKDNEFAVISKDSIDFYDTQLTKINKEISQIDWDATSAEKNGYEDFMLKEIYEQPNSIRETIGNHLSLNTPCQFDELNFSKEFLSQIHKIYIVACGTAMYAGLTAKTMLENICEINTEVDVASEFRYRNPLINKNTLCIFITQSGETADTIAALKLAKSKGATTLAVSNVEGSSITREADFVTYTHAGPEIAVASTKAYTSQITLLGILVIYFAETLSKNTKILENMKKSILELPAKTEQLLSDITEIKNFAHEVYQVKDVFFLGRGLDYNSSVEGSLKLKEISYIHSEAFYSGELKHGPIALIEKDTLVVSVLTVQDLMDKSISNIQEVITRGAKTLIITDKILENSNFTKIIKVPETNQFLTPILSIIPLQLFAYYISKEKGLDVDKPRNLAKSVTVE